MTKTTLLITIILLILTISIVSAANPDYILSHGVTWRHLSGNTYYHNFNNVFKMFIFK